MAVLTILHTTCSESALFQKIFRFIRQHSRMKCFRPLLIGVFASICAAAQDQSVDRGIRERTGFAIPDANEKGQATFSLPAGITIGAVLPADDAVAIALWNNTAFQAALAGLAISRADIIEARQFRNPNFSTLLPVGPKPFEFLLAWPIEELWQRRKRVKAAELNLDSVSTGLVQNGLDLVRDVRLAYSDLWLAESRARVLSESADLRARLAGLTEKLRNAGDGTGLDVGMAQVDALSAADLAQVARSEIEIARSRLRFVMGIADRTQRLATNPDRVQRQPLPELATLLETAAANRPDLRAAELMVEVNAERAKWQRSQILALMAPVLSIKEIGTEGVWAGPGLNMEIPILSRNHGRISRTDAEVVRAGRDYAALKDRINKEVVEARERILQTLASQNSLAQQVRPRVEASIRITQRAYENGDLSLLNVLEVTRQKFDIELRELEMYVASEKARAELERAIGRRL